MHQSERVLFAEKETTPIRVQFTLALNKRPVLAKLLQRIRCGVGLGVGLGGTDSRIALVHHRQPVIA